MESDPAGAVAQLVTSVVDALRVMFVTYVEVTVVLDRSVLLELTVGPLNQFFQPFLYFADNFRFLF